MEKIALLPGGFKPPHAGHYNMAKWLAVNTDADTVIVKVGAKERDGITRDMSLKLWDLYRSTDSDPAANKLSIIPSKHNSPVKDVYDFIEQDAPVNSTIYLGMGEKEMKTNDQRFANIGKFADPKGINFETKLVPPQAGGVSGTDMRGFIMDKDQYSFFDYIPEHLTPEQKEQAWQIVTTEETSEWKPGDPVSFEMWTSDWSLKSFGKEYDANFKNREDAVAHYRSDKAEDWAFKSYAYVAKKIPGFGGDLEEDLYNPEDKVLDYMRGSEWKAGMPDGPKDDIPRHGDRIHNRQSSPHAHMSETTLNESTAVVHDQFIPLEVMDTPESQVQGMMGRNKLKGGMIFPYLDLGKREFHMQNCKIPLDIMFISNNEINKIDHNCPPCKTNNCPKYSGKADTVLELPGGYCNKNNVKVGDFVGINLYELPKPLNELDKEDLKTIDTYADKQLNPVDVDLTSDHFFDRLNDPRNQKVISSAELIGFFKRLARKKDEFVEFLTKYKELVVTDNRTNLNIPFMKLANQAIAKTVMRKKEFKTSNPQLSINESRGGESELHIYDFDETIARVETPIPYTVESPEGKTIEKGETTSIEFEKTKDHLKDSHGESIKINWDFKSFAKMISKGTLNTEVFQKLLNSISNPNAKVTILTARAIGLPVTKFLKDQGINAYVVPLGLNKEKGQPVTGEDKANWIENRIKNTTKKVLFIDDSSENRKAIYTLRDKYPNIEFDVENPLKIKLNELSDREIKFFATHSDILKQLNTPNFKLKFLELHEELEGERLEALEYFWDEYFSNLEDSCEIEGAFDKKVNETKYGGQYQLSQHMGQIKLDHGHQQYRNLQTLMSQQKDEEVNNWLKSKGYIKEASTFSKDWWSKIINESLITEGGAAGHMAHPFNLSSVNSGKDLKDIFNKSAESLQSNPGAVKIDGVNSSIRLVDLDGKKQFVMDRGSKKPLDIKGITKADLEDRFKPGHGMVKVGGQVLDMFNEALPSLTNDLKKLGAWDDPNILFNMEYVSGKTNVQDYGSNFIAIHGLNKVESKEVQGKRGPLIKRSSSEMSYDKPALQSMLDNLTPIAKKNGFEVYGSVPTEMKKKPNFGAALSKSYTVKSNEGDKTQSLDAWLSELNNIPEEDFIFMNVNDAKKKVGAVSKQVYVTLLNGDNIDELYESEEDKQKAIEGFVTYLATEKLGDEILKVLDSPMGTVDNHEGVVIRDKNITAEPFKITGKFILGGMFSDF